MSMIGGRFPQGADEVGQTIASFPTYDAAQKAVSSLIAAEVPARDIAIVGQGLRSVERVTGRLGYASAARSGAINGVLLGLLFSAILVIGSPSVPIQAFVGVLFVGIAIGMLLSIVTYSFVRRRRDYASVMQVVADHYEVTVTAASIHRARQVLGPQTVDEPMSASRPGTPREEAPEPPRYGERVAPAEEEEATGSGADATPEVDATTAAGAPVEPAAPEPAAPEPAAPEQTER
ncbi:general stress protein [Microbacterium sulfonylureivorans]|uniref:general stress protein n=1 Tax=Microbacterium sulfonylureivorans TaxID=2486854 RepID=UPI00197C0268|nr:general stress protein [Microbacterium sulfonylureivorans]